MHDFHAAMEKREQLSIRIGRRTTQIMRFSMLIMVAFSIALFVLINTLTTYLVYGMGYNMNQLSKLMNHFPFP